MNLANCPFRKVGAIELNPGRLQGIIDDAMADDESVFFCHKTTNGEETNEGVYMSDGNESYCAGSLIYLHKARNPNVAMRLGHALGLFDPARLAGSFDEVIDP
jgi:hypothetical protein